MDRRKLGLTTPMLRVSAVLFVLTACTRKDPPDARTTLAEAASPEKSAPAASAPSVASVPPVASAAPVASQEVSVPVSAALQDTCTKLCERSKSLKCRGADDCVPNCLAMGSVMPCSQEIGVLFPCLLEEPIQHWECDESGTAAIRDGYCDKEQAAAIACMEKKMQ